jgi:hypothetical protein
VPPVSSTVGEFEFSGLSLPSGEVGGDLIDVVTLPADASQSGATRLDTGLPLQVEGT